MLKSFRYEGAKYGMKYVTLQKIVKHFKGALAKLKSSVAVQIVFYVF